MAELFKVNLSCLFRFSNVIRLAFTRDTLPLLLAPNPSTSKTPLKRNWAKARLVLPLQLLIPATLERASTKLWNWPWERWPVSFRLNSSLQIWKSELSPCRSRNSESSLMMKSSVSWQEWLKRSKLREITVAKSRYQINKKNVGTVYSSNEKDTTSFMLLNWTLFSLEPARSTVFDRLLDAKLFVSKNLRYFSE